MADERYHVHITLHDEDQPVQSSLALTEAFGGLPTELRARTLSFARGHDDVVVDFVDVTAVPGVPPSPLHVAEQDVLDRLADLELEPQALVPVVKALLGVAVARRRAGLPAHGRMTIDVEPQPAPAPLASVDGR